MQSLYNKLEHLENLIIAMNQNGMKRIRLPIPEEYGGGYATGVSLESAVHNLIKRIETHKIDQSPLFSDYYNEWMDLKKSEDLSVVTIANYEGIAQKHILPYFGDKHIFCLRILDIVLMRKSPWWKLCQLMLKFLKNVYMIFY